MSSEEFYELVEGMFHERGKRILELEAEVAAKSKRIAELEAMLKIPEWVERYEPFFIPKPTCAQVPTRIASGTGGQP